jgi:hypothetical protein
MENFDPQEQQKQEVKLVVTEEMRSYIYDMTKWARMFAILGFVLSITLILGSFSIGAIINSNPALLAQIGPLGKSGTTVITVFYLIIGLLYFYPSILLFKFSNKGKQGVLFGEQESLNEAFYSIKSLFKFFGIVTIIAVVAYFIFAFAAFGKF